MLVFDTIIDTILNDFKEIKEIKSKEKLKIRIKIEFLSMTFILTEY
jgi:hypothetical protein